LPFHIAIREKYQLPSNYLLSVGTIEKRKNLVALLEAASNIDIPIVVIGNRTAYFQEVSQKVAQLKMKKRVIFLSEEFENQINQVLSSDQSQRVKKGYDFVKKFSTENHVKEIKSIYNELLK